MGIVSGSITARRFKVVGDVPEDWRISYRDRLREMAFREPLTPITDKVELEGWVEVQNLLDTGFDDPNAWLHNDVAVFCLRVDKKTLPANLLRATVDKKCREWAAEAGVEKVPSRKKAEIKEELEDAWMKRQLPRVGVTQIAWNVPRGWALVGGLSAKTIERVRTRFHRTFGLVLQPWSPLDWLEPGDGDALLSTSPAAFGGEA